MEQVYLFNTIFPEHPVAYRCSLPTRCRLPTRRRRRCSFLDTRLPPAARQLSDRRRGLLSSSTGRRRLPPGRVGRSRGCDTNRLPRQRGQLH